MSTVIDMEIFPRWIVTCYRNAQTFSLCFGKKTFELDLNSFNISVEKEKIVSASDCFRSPKDSDAVVFGYNEENPGQCTYRNFSTKTDNDYCIVDNGWFDPKLQHIFLFLDSKVVKFVVTTEKEYFAPTWLVSCKSISREQLNFAYRWLEKDIDVIGVGDYSFKHVGDQVYVTAGNLVAVWDRYLTKRIAQHQRNWILTGEQKQEVLSICLDDFDPKNLDTKHLFDCLPTPDLTLRSLYREAQIPLPERIETIFAEAKAAFVPK